MKVASIKVKRDIYARLRDAMVESQIIARGTRHKALIEAMRLIPRHLFVEEALWAQAYSDFPLPIGHKQTISQPYMVAFMTESLGLTGKEKVLEIGGGSGYHTAVLSMLSDRVYSIERIPQIASRARRVLDSLSSSNVVMRIGDGTMGWPEEAPFDAVIVAASSPDVPPAYLEQLSLGGRLIMPVGGSDAQALVRVTKKDNGARKEVLGACRFVRLIGRHGWKDGEGGVGVAGVDGVAGGCQPDGVSAGSNTKRAIGGKKGGIGGLTA